VPPADHDLHTATEPGDPEGCLVGPVAVRAGAIDHDEGIRGEVVEPLERDVSPGEAVSARTCPAS
jgi:hypothetical protein